MIVAFFKFILGAFIGLIILIVGTIVLGLGAVNHALNSEIAPTAGQNVTIEGNKALVTALLDPVQGLELKGYKSCSFQEKDELDLDPFREKGYRSRGAFCNNSECVMNFTFAGSVPEKTELVYKSEETGKCVVTYIDPRKDAKIVGYNSEISIHGDLKDFVASDGDETGLKKDSNSKYTSNSSMTYGGNTKLYLHYDEAVNKDSFLYNGKSIEVIYEAKQ